MVQYVLRNLRSLARMIRFKDTISERVLQIDILWLKECHNTNYGTTQSFFEKWSMIGGLPLVPEVGLLPFQWTCRIIFARA